MINIDTLPYVEGALVGAVIGDQMGMPVEKLTPQQILEFTEGKGVDDFLPSFPGSFGKKHGFKAKEYTDDFQQTAMVARSLIRKNGVLDPYDIADEHVRGMSEVKRGTWGRSTRSAIQDYRDGKRKPTDVPAITAKTGLGNGVAMKIAPVAILFANEGLETLWKHVKTLGIITHGDPRAWIAALVVAVMHRAGTPEVAEKMKPEYLTVVSDVAATFEESEGVSNEISQKILRSIDLINDPVKTREEIGCGFTSLETAPFTVATAVRNITNFRKGILEAVNAGGDADTNASIVGSIIGGAVGIGRIPLEWREDNPGVDEALELARGLHALTLRQAA